jgi:hypothetical protein
MQHIHDPQIIFSPVTILELVSEYKTCVFATTPSGRSLAKYPAVIDIAFSLLQFRLMNGRVS